MGRMRKSARGLARLGVRFDVILTSPLTRARQTAEIVAAALESSTPIVTVDSLVPDAAPASVLADLQKHQGKKRIALVGHAPHIGALAASLVGALQPFELKKGAVCRIDVEPLAPDQGGQLRWFVTPSMLRAVGK